MDGSKQKEKFNQETIDRYVSGPLYFSENHMEIAVLTYRPIPEEMGKVVAYQYTPCEHNFRYEQMRTNAFNDTNCSNVYALHYLSEVPVQDCTAEFLKELDEWVLKHEGETQMGWLNATCVFLNNTFIEGEPSSITEASLLVGFSKHPDIITDPDNLDYDEEKDMFFADSNPQIQVDFSQVDMKEGTLERVTKVFEMLDKDPTGISLSQNKLIDQNDYFGLMHTNPEPQTFFSVDQRLKDYELPWQAR